ncbi:MAG: GatB/YqeY domain-containing protein [Acidobacteria bacterium]|nr:GatB/YqeY domain-containing protein [Acidobacteriota bacterium]
MTIQERIQEDIKEAMRLKDALRLDVLRGMKTAIKNKEIEKIRILEETEVFQVLHTLVKQRKESIDQFKKGGRADLVSREEDELQILESYLPAAVSEEEIRKVIVEVIAELQVTSPKDIGKVMKGVMGKFAGKIIDGKLVNELARAQLEG